MQYRHGDLLIEKIDQIPEAAQPAKDDERDILAHGEATGHAHRVQGAGNKDLAVIMTLAAAKYIAAAQACTVVHEEHHEIVLPPGDYKVTVQEEYTPQGMRQVTD
jgi:hypothetical protein